MADFSHYNSQLDAFELYHKVQEEQSAASIGPGLPALGHAIAGSTGSAISNLAVYPLALVITRLQVQRQLQKSFSTKDISTYDGVLDACTKIYYREGGIKAFYSGILQDTGKSIADSFLFFLAYNYLRTSRLEKHGRKATTLPVLDELTVGALAGAFSKFITTPLANVVTRKQTASMIAAQSGSTVREPSASEIASQIRSEKGLQGFWSGYSASLVLTLNPSLTFFLYETFKRMLLPRSRRDDPGARITFLMAAMSKAIASTITYPFSLAKARAQASSKAPVNANAVEEIKEEAKAASNMSSIEQVGKDSSNLAKRSNVFTAILDIYKTEGLSALYEGVLGEIFKGFFSHGITMLVKEAVHKLIIQAYYMVLRALQKYPAPSEVASNAGSAITQTSSDASEKVNSGYEYATKEAEKAVDATKDGLKTAEEKLRVLGGNATEAAKQANDLASQEAGHLLGNAQEQLGNKLQDLGKGIKPSEDK